MIIEIIKISIKFHIYDEIEIINISYIEAAEILFEIIHIAIFSFYRGGRGLMEFEEDFSMMN